jgi:hypothetical protein
MHEVGHTLGLRHNFRASTIYSLKQLQDPEFTRKNSMTGSVMDYTPFNLSLKGEKQGEYVASTLGPYDYWAIEYAYKPIEPAQEKQELAKIAARSNEPQLAFGTDQDASGFNLDPGCEPVRFGQRSAGVLPAPAGDFARAVGPVQNRTLKPGESYEVLRRSFDYGFQQFARTLPVVVKYVGGVTYLRDHAGTGRATFTPVPLPRQRAALQMLTDSLFKADSFKFSPATISRLASIISVARAAGCVGRRAGAGLAVGGAGSADVGWRGDALAGFAGEAGGPQAGAEPRRAVWIGAERGVERAQVGQGYQRHAAQPAARAFEAVVAALLRVSAGTPADVRSLQRENALQLQRDLRAAMAKPVSREAKAHLSESYETLGQALKASMLRAGA